jgi:hypothetical protein
MDDPMSDDEDLIIYTVPSLIAVLINRERDKGVPLSEAEVLDIRDDCEATTMPRDVAQKVDEARGYLDIDRENCWEEWQQARKEFFED